jgi:hypothetical protein
MSTPRLLNIVAVKVPVDWAVTMRPAKPAHGPQSSLKDRFDHSRGGILHE